jgi:hypothetical protein
LPALKVTFRADYGEHDMDPGPVCSGSNPEIAAELTRPRGYPADADARAERRALLPIGSRIRSAASVVGDYQMQAACNPPQVDGGMCRGRVPMHIGERFLNDAEERSLHSEWQPVDHRARLERDVQP